MARCFASLAALIAVGHAAAEEDKPALPSPQELEARGAKIGKITVIPGDVFDTTIKGESGWLYRTANKLHIDTRPAVIRGQLLFETGDTYSERLLQETERNLRANPYLYDASIVPVAYDGVSVDIEVRTRDTWTLNPGVNFSRTGGKNEYAVQIQEKNLFGRGQELQVQWESDVERQALTFLFADPHFLKSYKQLAVAYSDADDGDTKYFRAGPAVLRTRRTLVRRHDAERQHVPDGSLGTRQARRRVPDPGAVL